MRLRRESKRRLRRLRRRHRDGTGVFVVTRFSLFKMSLSRSARTGVFVLIERKTISLHSQKRGPKWVPLAPRKEHHLRVTTDGQFVVDLKVRLNDHEQRVLYVEPRNDGRDIVRLVSPTALDEG